MEDLGDSRHPRQRKQLWKGPEAGMSSGGSKRRRAGKEAERKAGTLALVVGTGLSVEVWDAAGDDVIWLRSEESFPAVAKWMGQGAGVAHRPWEAAVIAWRQGTVAWTSVWGVEEAELFGEG